MRPLSWATKALLLDGDVIAILENLQDRGIGRRPPDAELLHALHEARLGINAAAVR